MKSIELAARAKINLSLDVLGKRSDGYHEVRMIMQTIDLHDTVIIEKVSAGIDILDESGRVPQDERNTAYKAADMLIKEFGIKSGLRIILKKRIPVAAGLAGGSSDAAAVLKGMNSLFSLDLTLKELMERGRNIGADVPFCILGGTALAEGTGEVLTALDPFRNINIVLVKPRARVSTKWVYGELALEQITVRPDTDLMISAMKEKQMDIVAKNMINVLEPVTLKKVRVIEEIKKKLMKYGAKGSVMSGSGPTVFGIFEDDRSARDAYVRIKDNGWATYLTKTCFEGGR